MKPSFAASLLLGLCCSLVAKPTMLFGQQTTQQFVTISQETTWLTEPVTEDGYVDYLKALNQLNAVPFPDNAAADLILLQGIPSYWESVQRERLQLVLGSPHALPTEGDRLKSQTGHYLDAKNGGQTVPENEEWIRQTLLVESQPWIKSDAPLLNEWIEANAHSLSHIDNILGKRGYFEPMMFARERHTTFFPEPCGIAVDGERQLRTLLLARSFRSLGEGKADHAIEDHLRIFRLARLKERAKVVDGLFTHDRLEHAALEAGRTLLESKDLDLKLLANYLASLSQLEPVGRAQTGCFFRRLCRLAEICLCAQESPKGYLARSLAEVDNLYIVEANSEQVDWDYLLRSVNKQFDHIESIHQLPSTVARIQSMQELSRKAQLAKPHFFKREEFEAAFDKDPQLAKRQLADDLGHALDSTEIELYATYEEFSLKAKRDMLRIMLAAKLYQKQHGTLPTSFDLIRPALDPDVIDPYNENVYGWKWTDQEIQIRSACNDMPEIPRAWREWNMTIRP